MCEHQTVILHKCMACGVSMVHTPQDRVPNGTVPNLLKYRIPPEVRARAMLIYNTKMRVDLKKGVKRKELEFFLIYSLHLETIVNNNIIKLSCDFRGPIVILCSQPLPLRPCPFDTVYIYSCLYAEHFRKQSERPISGLTTRIAS